MAEADSVYYDSGDYDETEGTVDGSGSGDENDMPDGQPHIHKQTNNAKAGSVMTIFLVSVMAFMLLGTVIYTHNRRNVMYNKAAAMNQKLSVQEAENARLQSELESKLSAKNIEDYAENVLGMQKIDSSQIKYIKISTGDVVNIPEQKKGIGAKIKSFFERCVEYFRG